MIQRLTPRVGLYVGGLGLAAGVFSGACGGGGSGNVVTPPGDDGGGSGASSGLGSSGTGGTGVGSGSSGADMTSGMGGTGVGSGSSGSGVGSGMGGTGVSSGTSVPNDAGMCPAQASIAVALKVTIPVGWPATSAGNSGTGNINIWFLAVQNFAAGSTMYMGPTQSCATVLPDLTLNSTIAAILGGSKVQIAILPSTFDAIANLSHGIFTTTGMQSGWDPGATVTADPTLGGLGLVAGSTYLKSSTAWPPDCKDTGSNCVPAGSFKASDLTNDDGVTSGGGITATPTMGNGYLLPPTDGLALNKADKVYIVLRQELAITGTRVTDCNQSSGTAKLTLFDNHVVGCHVSGGSACNSAQVGFLDQNRTKYTNMSGASSANPPAISATNAVMGTFTTKTLQTGAKCSDVRAAIP